MHFKKKLVAIMVLCYLTLLPIWITAMENKLPVKNVTPLEQAHSHNDYEHDVPLFDALNHGFTKIEPDVFILYKDPITEKLIDDKLEHFNKSEQKNIKSYVVMVGHDPGDYKGTLYDLYIKPLEQLQPKERVIEGYNKPILYMIDMKTNYPGSIEFMNIYLSQFKNIFCSYDSELFSQPVKVILSGYNRNDFLQEDLDYLLTVKNRYLAIDGRVDNPLLEQEKNSNIFPLISNSWNNRDDETFHDNIKNTHMNGQIIRYWGTKDNKEAWNKMYTAGVDVISTDNHKGVQDFFKSKEG